MNEELVLTLIKMRNMEMIREYFSIGVNLMLGMLVNNMEQKEIEYLIKRELEELLLDLEDSRIDLMVKRAMSERYKLLFQLFRRVASEKECMKYIPKKIKNE